MPYPLWTSPFQCFQVHNPAQPPQVAVFLLGTEAWMGHIFQAPPNYRAPDNCLYLKQVLAQVLLVQGTLSGRGLLCRLYSYAPHLPLGICIHSLPIQLISSQLAVKTTLHGLIRTIPAKRSACFCLLRPFLPFLPLGAKRPHSLKLAYPSCN